MVYDNKLFELMNKNDKHFTINELMKTDKSLKISIGSFVWNQHKDILSDMNSENLPVLIYNPNNIERRSYVKTDNENHIHHEKCIIINRGYSKNIYKFSVELIEPNDFPNGFICENHLLVITSDDENVIDRIYKSLNHKDTIEYINTYITNGAMNTNDLQNNILLFED